MKIIKTNLIIIAVFFTCLILLTCISAASAQDKSAGPTLPKVMGTSYTVNNQQEFDDAVDKIQAGDQIILANNGDWKGVKLDIAKDGTADKPIIIRAETNGKVNLSYSSSMSVGGDWIYISGLKFTNPDPQSTNRFIIELKKDKKFANHTTITNCVFDDYSAENPETSSTWIQVYGAHNSIEYCYVGNKENSGMCLTVNHYDYQPNYTHIYRNFFYRPFSYNNQQNGQEIMRLGGTGINMLNLSDCKVTVEGNMFYKCDGEIEIISIKSYGVTVKDNTFLECDGTVTMRRGGKATICGNYFIGDGVSNSGGIRVTNINNKIFNNYFYKMKADSRSGIILHMGFPDTKIREYYPCRYALVANNTFVDCENVFNLGANTSFQQWKGTVPPDGDVTGNLIIRSGDQTLFERNEEYEYDGLVFSDNLDIKDGKPAKFTRSTMNIAGIEVPKYVSKKTYEAPSFITTDISGAARGAKTPIGAIADGNATPKAAIATKENCGPTWSWKRP